jgi:L-2-hydroxyglutarate oxidase
VIALSESADGVDMTTAEETVRARYVVVCAGVMADRLARMCGIQTKFRIVPFRGEYFRLPQSKNSIVKHLIYPVPDPTLPFLGVHLTRMMGGFVTVGPNAVLGLAREGYRRGAINWRDVADTFSFGGFWALVSNHGRSGVKEFWDSINRRGYLALCRRYCPELTLADLQPHPAGIRAQAVLNDGSLVHDFLILRTARTVHVCNAPSPAATSAIPIGRHIAQQLLAADV